MNKLIIFLYLLPFCIHAQQSNSTLLESIPTYIKGKEFLQPTITRDNKQLIWIQRWDTLVANQKVQYNITMVSSWVDSSQKWSAPMPLYTIVPIPKHSSIVDVSMDGQVYYYITFDPTAQNDQALHNNGIEFIYKTASGWSNPQQIEIKDWNKLVHSTYSNYRFSPDRRYLYLSFAQKKKNEIYVCKKIDDSHYDSPKKINAVNSSLVSCHLSYISADGNTMYFSKTNYFNIATKYDIYYSQKTGDKPAQWSKPMALSNIINTYSSEPYWAIDNKNKFAYLIRDKGLVAYDMSMVLSPPTCSYISGNVLTSKDSSAISATIKTVYPDGSNITTQSNPITGEYFYLLPHGGDYMVQASCVGYFPLSQKITTDSVNIFQTLYLAPIQSGERIPLETILFEQSKATLLPESLPELEAMVEMMKSNPNVNILLEGHTDNVGSREALVELSKQRALAVKKYLVKNEIAANRIEIAALGSSVPRGDNHTEEGRRLNRRVEMVIK
ncbi:MAG: OmpA family protein [Cytophagaceae bacterium]